MPFVIFLIAATAELNRPPFDLVEAEQELVGGFNTEYSSHPLRPVLPRRVHEHDHDGGVIVTLFLGGPQPIARDRHPVHRRSGCEGVVWFFLKLLVFLYIYVWFRATLPRLRYDQLMDLGWKVLIPLSLGWFLLLAALPRRPTTRTGTAGWSASSARRRGRSCRAACCSLATAGQRAQP